MNPHNNSCVLDYYAIRVGSRGVCRSRLFFNLVSKRSYSASNYLCQGRQEAKGSFLVFVSLNREVGASSALSHVSSEIASFITWWIISIKQSGNPHCFCKSWTAWECPEQYIAGTPPCQPLPVEPYSPSQREVTKMAGPC